MCVCVYATFDELLTYFNQFFGPFPREICKSLEYITQTKADIYDSRTTSHFIWQDSSNSDMQVWVSSFYLFICVLFVCYFVSPFTLEWKIKEVSALFLSSVSQPSWNWPSGPPGKYIGLLEGAGLNTDQCKSCQPAWLPSYTQAPAAITHKLPPSHLWVSASQWWPD